MGLGSSSFLSPGCRLTVRRTVRKEFGCPKSARLLYASGLIPPRLPFPIALHPDLADKDLLKSRGGCRRKLYLVLVGHHLRAGSNRSHTEELHVIVVDQTFSHLTKHDHLGAF